jgi:hypothetical protein
MNIDTEMDLSQLHDTMTAAIRAHFPAFQTVEFYRAEGDALPLPACLLAMSEFEGAPEADPGTGQLAVMMRFKAELAIGLQTPDEQRAIRVLAAAFAAFLHEKRWPGRFCGPVQAIRAYPDQRQPSLAQARVWCVEWRQIAHLGAGAWHEEGSPPTSVYLGFAPDIGMGNEEKYISVAGIA